MSTTRAEEAAAEPTAPVIQQKVKRRWVSYIWDTFDKPPEERRLLFKLDSAVLTFASLGMFLRPFSLTPHLMNIFLVRVLYQISGSNQHQQCFRVRNEGRSRTIWKWAQLHADMLDCWLCNWGDSEQHPLDSSQTTILDPSSRGTFLRFLEQSGYWLLPAVMDRFNFLAIKMQHGNSILCS